MAPSRNNINVLRLVLALGLASLTSLIVVNPVVLGALASDGQLDSVYTASIARAQLALAIEGIALAAIGLVGLKLKAFRGLNEREGMTNWLLAAVIGLWSLAQCEILLRIKPQLSTEQLLQQSVPYESSILSKHKIPRAPFDVVNGDGTLRFKLRKGYHGDDFPFVKPKGELRIVFMGGSFVFSDHEPFRWSQEPHNPNWVAKVEDKLHAKGHPRVRAINAAVPGHATFDSIGRLIGEIHLLAPDCVVLCHAWNDIIYFDDLSAERSLLRKYRALPRPTHTRPSALRAMAETSQIYVRIANIVSCWVERIQERRASRRQGPKHELSQAALRQFRLDVEVFIDVCRRMGAKPVLVTQPRFIDPSNTEAEKAEFKAKGRALSHAAFCRAYQEIDAILRQTAANEKVLLCDLARQFTAQVELFHDHVHLTAKGAEGVSDALATFIESSVLGP